LPASSASKLADAGIGFYRWHDGSCRFVCSWATCPGDLDAVTAALRART
jgi:threonine aldolase